MERGPVWPTFVVKKGSWSDSWGMCWMPTGEARAAETAHVWEGAPAGSPSLPRGGGRIEWRQVEVENASSKTSWPPWGAWPHPKHKGPESRFSDSRALGFNFLPSPFYKILLQGIQCAGDLEATQAPCPTAVPSSRSSHCGLPVALSVRKGPIAPWRWLGHGCGGKSNFYRAWGKGGRGGVQWSHSSPRPPILSQQHPPPPPVVHLGFTLEPSLSLTSLPLCSSPPCGSPSHPYSSLYTEAAVVFIIIIIK